MGVYGVMMPMTQDVDLLYAEVVETDSGDGSRIYTSRDEVYEALEDVDGTASRIHPEQGGWRSTVRLPAGDRQESYAAFRAVADRVEEAYDTDLPMDWLTFQEDFEAGNACIRDGGITLRYNTESGISIPQEQFETYGEAGTMIGLFTGGLGPAFAGFVGGMAGVLPPETIFLGIPGMFAGMAAGGGAGYLGPKARQWYTSWRRQQQYGDAEALTEESLITRLNEHRSLEVLLSRDEPFSDDITDRYNELDGENLDAVFDLLTETHFDQFPEAEGVTVTGLFDTYEEAARFPDVIRDRAPQEHERPSIYRNPDAFRTMFDHLTFTMKGETYVLEDAYRMAEELLEREEADPEITTWLDETYPAIVKEAGRAHALGGGEAA